MHRNSVRRRIHSRRRRAATALHARRHCSDDDCRHGRRTTQAPGAQRCHSDARDPRGPAGQHDHARTLRSHVSHCRNGRAGAVVRRLVGRHRDDLLRTRRRLFPRGGVFLFAPRWTAHHDDVRRGTRRRHSAGLTGACPADHFRGHVDDRRDQPCRRFADDDCAKRVGRLHQHRSHGSHSARSRRPDRLG